MNLSDRITSDLNAAMKARELLRVATLRMLIAAMRNRAIELRVVRGAPLGDEEILRLIRSETKKRRDAIEAFQRGGRRDAAEKEEAERAILEEYLPQEINEETLLAIVTEEIARIENPSMKEFGRIMGTVMKRVGLEASGDRVSGMVKMALGGK